MEPEQIVIFALVALAAGGAFYALFYPSLSGETRVERRRQAILGGEAGARAKAASAREQNRRVQVSESLKELEQRQKKAKMSLPIRLERAGLSWSKNKFYVISAAIGLVFGLVSLISFGQPLIAAGALFIGAFGVPRWILGFRIKRRTTRFLDEFPNAIDLIVRGVKAGLPLGDCVRMVATQTQDPVQSEFRSIMETQAVGMPLPEAVERMAERMNLPEANFFAIVITIQQQSGGSLADALGNLSRVLRDRRKMKGKIQALSMEAKASAAIIGSLPVIVALLLHLTSPGYISMLWTTNVGLVLLMGSAIWMSMGVLVMRKMINFDF